MAGCQRSGLGSGKRGGSVSEVSREWKRTFVFSRRARQRPDFALECGAFADLGANLDQGGMAFGIAGEKVHCVTAPSCPRSLTGQQKGIAGAAPARLLFRYNMPAHEVADITQRGVLRTLRQLRPF